MRAGKSVCGATLELPLTFAPLEKPKSSVAQAPAPRKKRALPDELAAFAEFGKETRVLSTKLHLIQQEAVELPTYINEFWTARQRQASSLHEVSYRACFKPQLPRFFIERLTEPGDIVYDPFMGRGTTPLEAALLGRVPWGNDVNPLSVVMTQPRLRPPTLEQVSERLREIPFDRATPAPEELLVFYHPKTLQSIAALKEYLQRRKALSQLDAVDWWIALVALNRLTGHSSGFFSVYTLPPNQAVSVKSQIKINQKRNQIPPERNVPQIILKKTRQLLGEVTEETRRTLQSVADRAQLTVGPAEATPALPSNTAALVVTSPPFLDIVQYATDNWLRCWFLGIDQNSVKLTVPKKIEDWQTAMTRVFSELHRVLKPGGHVAFEVGEVHSGKTKLEEAVVPAGMAAGLVPWLILINDQKFTKTANCWGVDNMSKGTNTNRIVVFSKG
jgi:hypothetical protein